MGKSFFGFQCTARFIDSIAQFNVISVLLLPNIRRESRNLLSKLLRDYLFSWKAFDLKLGWRIHLIIFQHQQMKRKINNWAFQRDFIVSLSREASDHNATQNGRDIELFAHLHFMTLIWGNTSQGGTLLHLKFQCLETCVELFRFCHKVADRSTN